MIAIIDYGAGNLQSVKNALDYLSQESVITDDPKVIEQSDRVILPGVGSFGSMMQSLIEKGIDGSLRKCIIEGKPFLGICLGLQALFEWSEERPGAKGLGVLKGRVVKFRRGKVPQIGWNEVKPLEKGLLQKGYAYFVNSYYVVPEDDKVIAAKTDYFGDFVCAVKWKNVTAVQFHPEKSSEYGIDLLRRWLKC